MRVSSAYFTVGHAMLEVGNRPTVAENWLSMYCSTYSSWRGTALGWNGLRADRYPTYDRGIVIRSIRPLHKENITAVLARQDSAAQTMWYKKGVVLSIGPSDSSSGTWGKTRKRLGRRCCLRAGQTSRTACRFGSTVAFLIANGPCKAAVCFASFRRV